MIIIQKMSRFAETVNPSDSRLAFKNSCSLRCAASYPTVHPILLLLLLLLFGVSSAQGAFQRCHKSASIATEALRHELLRLNSLRRGKHVHTAVVASTGRTKEQYR